MRITLTPVQEQAIRHALQGERRQSVAPFPCSLLEQGLVAVFDGLEAIVRRALGAGRRRSKPA
jgi:hypothetical protein